MRHAIRDGRIGANRAQGLSVKGRSLSGADPGKRKKKKKRKEKKRNEKERRSPVWSGNTVLATCDEVGETRS